MKKQIQRIRLHRETLNRLDPASLAGIAAAATTHPWCPTQVVSCVQICP
jgi:hypothetical protein